jgi:hypothetical protein
MALINRHHGIIPERVDAQEHAIAAPDLDIAVAAVEHHADSAQSLLKSYEYVCALDVQSFGNKLRTTFASAPLPPTLDTTRAVQVESLLHIEEALYRRLQETQPSLAVIRTHLQSLSLQEHIANHVVQRAIESLRQLPDETTSLPTGDKFTRYGDACRKLSSVVSYSGQIQELVANNLSTAEKAPLQISRDSELWRQARLASELYECSRHESLSVLHEQFDVAGTHNKLSRQLPPFYEINGAELTATLIELTKDPELAQIITDNFLRSAETYQLWRVLIQGNLSLSCSVMQLIEERIPLQELAHLVEECKGSDVILGLLQTALQESKANLSTIEQLQDWATQLRLYCSSLTPFERWVPGISPWRNPDLFLQPGHCSKMGERLETIRADHEAQHALYRLVAMTRMEEALKTSSQASSSGFTFCFALLLSYGFGIPSESHKDANSLFDLTHRAYQLFENDMARIAPEVALPAKKLVSFQIHEILESLTEKGFIKHPSSPSGRVPNFFVLCPSVRRAENWPNILNLVSIIRSGQLSPERLLTGEPQTREKKRKEAPRSAKRSSPAALSSANINKTYLELKKSFKVFESALDELPKITREHLQRKQVSFLMSTAGRIRELHSKLENTSTQSDNPTHLEDLLAFLKPPLFSEHARMKDFVQTAKTSLHLLQSAITSAASDKERVC